MSTSQVLGVVGFVVGSYFGYPQLGYVLGSLAGSVIDANNVDGPNPGDLSAPGLTLGSGIPRAYGCVRLPVQWIWCSDWRATEGEGGGKGSGPPGPLTYSIDVAGVICHNTDIESLSRTWRNKKLIQTARPESSIVSQAFHSLTSNDNWAEAILMTGGPAQVPWSKYEDVVGAANAPAWRGLTVVAYDDLQCGGYKALPQMEVELNGGTGDARIFDFTGADQFYTVPEGVTDLTVEMWGGSGGLSGGFGGYTTDTIPVTPGETLTIEVGGTGSSSVNITTYFGGAGAPVGAGGIGGCGGGRSAITRGGTGLTVAGGGGGGGYSSLDESVSGGGSGGGLIGGSGSTPSGTAATGGTQVGGGIRGTIPGAGGSSGHDGGVGAGYAGGGGGNNTGGSVGGGGGGGAWGGAGGGTTNLLGGGGAGGSGFATAGTTTNGPAGTDSPYYPASIGRIVISGAGEGLTAVTLASILEAELALNPAYDAALYDFSDVADVMVDGYTAIGPFAEVAADLCNIHYVDIVPGDPIAFRKRGGATVATITNRDTGMAEGSAGTLFSGLKRHGDDEITAVKAIKAPDIDRNHEPLFVRSDRLTTEGPDISVIQTRTVMTTAKAMGRAITASILARLSRHTATVAWSDKYARIVPGDSVVQADHLGNDWRVHIARLTCDAGVNSAEVELEDATAFVETGITDETQANSFEIAVPGNTELLVVDGPILRDEDDTAGAYSFVESSNSEPYPGAAVRRSVDNATFDEVVASHATQSVIGTVTVPLPDTVNRFRWDNRATMTVNVGSTGQTLTSSTKAAMQADRNINVAYVGAHGRWIVLRFVIATLVSTGVYELGGILILRDTDDNVAANIAGDDFVLASSAMRRMSGSVVDVGQVRYLKGVTTGRSVASTASQSFTNNAVGLTPFRPGGLKVSRDGSSNAVFHVGRRSRLQTRFGGPGGSYFALGEADRRSSIDVYADDTFASIVRTINSTSGSDDIAYSAALQTTDGFTPGERLAVRAYTISTSVGRGHYRQKAAA